MQKIIIAIFLIIGCFKNYAQINSFKTINNFEPPNEIHDSVPLSPDDNEKASSYFIISTSVGNTLYGDRNNAIKSKTFVNNPAIYSPSVTYMHKSGLSLDAQAYFINNGVSGIGVHQYSITPGYELQGNKDVDFSVALAHYIVNDMYSPYASPIQNDFYISSLYKKTWLRPGIAIDYSAGTFMEVQRQRNLYDSTTNKIKSFSFIASVSHQFNLGEIFNIKDEFLFIPSIILNTGKSNTTIQHKTNTVNGASIFSRKKGKLAKFENTKFQPESIGFGFDFSYTTGNFIFAPQTYFDYTIPKTTLNKWATIFTLNISYIF